LFRAGSRGGGRRGALTPERSRKVNEKLDGIPEEMGEVSPSGRSEGGFMASLIDIFIDPVKVFRRVRDGLPWWQPYIVIAIATTAIVYFQQPITRQIFLLNERGLSQQQLQAQGEMMEKVGFVGLLAAPLIVLLMYVILAALCNVATNLAGGRPNFKKMLGLLSFTSFIGIIEQGLKLVIIHARGIENIASSDDLFSTSFSMNIFVKADGLLRAVLESLSIFQIWLLVIFAIGVSVIYGISRKAAIVPTAVLWILGVLMLMLNGLGG
jgi:hypothetical protein